MKIPLYKKRKTTLITLGAITLLLLLATGASLYVYKFDGNIFGWTVKKTPESIPSTNLDKPTDNQNEAGADVKKSTIDKSLDADTDSNTTPKSNSVDISITAASQNGDVFQLRTLITTLSNSGTCTLTLTKNQQNIIKTASVQALSSASTCKGFDIPISDLSSGDWHASIVYQDGDAKGTASKTITINQP